MKRRSKEINIFGMSALDLFASALGAFILIAVVLFPYFPNIDSSPENIAALQELLRDTQQQLEEAKQQSQDAQQQLQDTQQQLQAAKDEIKKIKIPDIDVVIAFDVTGSMGDEMEGLKSQVSQFIDVLALLAPTVGIGVVAFGDREYQYPTTTKNILEVTNSNAELNEIQSFFHRLTLHFGIGSGKNSDVGEAIDLALEEAINMNWRSIAERRYIVIITDDLVNPYKVAYTYRLASNFSVEEGSTVSIVAGDIHDFGVRSYLQELAKNGNGRFVDTHGSLIGAILSAILGK